jgi:hypothetical protein
MAARSRSRTGSAWLCLIAAFLALFGVPGLRMALHELEELEQEEHDHADHDADHGHDHHHAADHAAGSSRTCTSRRGCR